jgi:hypothetical protein
VYLQKAQKLAYVSLSCNKISLSNFKSLLELSVESCEVVAASMRKAVKKQILETKTCFYS